VRRRRDLPAWITQRLQTLIQRRVSVDPSRLEPQLPARLLARSARLIGVGIHSERVKPPPMPVDARG